VRRRDDVIVLTETSAGAGTLLLHEGLEERGYAVIATPPANDRGVLIASRLPVRERICATFDVTLPWRIAAIRLTTEPSVTVLGIYVPSRDRSPAKVARKQKLILSFLKSLAGLPPKTRRNLVIAGDYNVVSRRHVPPRRSFFPYEYEMHETLEELGFVSSHEIVRKRKHPHSWIGRTGEGYLYDYIHVGEALQSRLHLCRYVDDTRARRLSDHLAVAASWRLDAASSPAG
jgi:exodeoxyribonuclease-3